MLQRRTIYCAAIIALLQISAFCGLTVQAADTSALVSNSLLSHAGMKSAWQLNLPIKADEDIDRLFIYDKYLYALTDHNYLFCVDRAKGKIRFGLPVAAKKVPLHDPFYYDNELIFMDGATIKFVDPNSGTISYTREITDIGRNAVCTVSKNADDLFISGTNNRISVIAQDGYWRRFWVSADDDSMITSILSDDHYVVFSTEGGSVVKIPAMSVNKSWQYNAPDKITAALVSDGNYIYASSTDSKIYKVDYSTGKLVWKGPFQAGHALITSVVVGENSVYQYAGDNGLYAVNKETGDKVWQVKNGIGLLAEKGGKTYVFAAPGRLVAMDNNTGKKLLSVNFGSVTDFAANTTDASIYVASDDGKLMSVEVVR